MSRPRGLAPWRPQAKTRLLLDQVQAVLAEYADHLPLTLRQVFYRLVGAYDYDKTEAAYERLAEALNRAWRAGIVPFEAILSPGPARGSAGRGRGSGSRPAGWCLRRSGWRACLPDFGRTVRQLAFNGKPERRLNGDAVVANTSRSRRRRRPGVDPPWRRHRPARRYGGIRPPDPTRRRTHGGE